jgi:hypothetical protein
MLLMKSLPLDDGYFYTVWTTLATRQSPLIDLETKPRDVVGIGYSAVADSSIHDRHRTEHRLQEETRHFCCTVPWRTGESFIARCLQGKKINRPGHTQSDP